MISYLGSGARARVRRARARVRRRASVGSAVAPIHGPLLCIIRGPKPGIIHNKGPERIIRGPKPVIIGQNTKIVECVRKVKNFCCEDPFSPYDLGLEARRALQRAAARAQFLR